MNASPFQRLKHLVAASLPGDAPGFRIAWQCPSNIALVKYWGKREGQLPVNPSLSMTLERAITRTSVTFTPEPSGGRKLSVNGDPAHPFLPKIRNLTGWLEREVPASGSFSLEINTSNTFPHSTGIASSASGMGALALCLVSGMIRISGEEFTRAELFRMASVAARMGSGSACRSLFGGFTLWGKDPSVPGSSDEFAIPVADMVHPGMLTLKDTILIISREPKSLPSSLGHDAMKVHPFASSRVSQARQNLSDMLGALKNNDLEKLAEISENEALTLHALIMSSRPGAILMKPATIEAIRRIREARSQGLPLFFTLDAGANVHLLYPAFSSGPVTDFINDALAPLCDHGERIDDGCGNGPAEILENEMFP